MSDIFSVLQSAYATAPLTPGKSNGHAAKTTAAAK